MRWFCRNKNTALPAPDDRADRVVRITDLPQSSIGAPCPQICAGEHSLLLAYYLQDAPADWTGETVRVITPETDGLPVSLVNFSVPYAHHFGPPNDEAFAGHPLAAKGLEPHGAFQIEQSSWIQRLEKMNAVHPYHKKEAFDRLKHFVFSFHDTTFECVAEDYRFAIKTGSVVKTLLASAMNATVP